jgi:hypothetical protein
MLGLENDEQSRVTCRFQKRLIIQSTLHVEYCKETISICLDATLTHLSVKVAQSITGHVWTVDKL